MRFKGLDLNLLIALDALLAEKSVSHAAVRVHRSQPAMSSALAKLRAHFGDELLAPLGNRLVLTSFGETLAKRVRALMEHIELTVDLSAAFDPATARRNFVLCANDYLFELIMPRIGRRLAGEAPGVTLDFISAALNPEDLIESGQVDLLVINSEAVSHLFPFEPITREEYVVLGCAGNPCLREGALTVEAFFKLGRVASRVGPRRRYSFAEMQLQRIPEPQRIEIVTPSIVSIPKFLIGTTRVAMVHRSLAEELCRTLPLAYCPSPIAFQPFQLGLQHHPARADDAGLEWLKDVIRSAFKTQVPAA